MEGFDIDVPGTIRSWPRWKQRIALVAGIILLSWGILYFIWFLLMPDPAASILR